jgi:hypothetical protein
MGWNAFQFFLPSQVKYRYQVVLARNCQLETVGSEI